MRRRQPPLPLKVASTLADELARRGLAVANLAAGTGMSTRALRRKLAGRCPFDVEELKVMTDWFGWSFTDLFRRVEGGQRY